MGEDARFWEIPLSPELLEQVAGAADLGLGDDGGGEDDAARSAARDAIFEQLREIVASSLTDRQRLIVHAYFYDGASQEEIAARLGISQQSVSRQLFGAVREGRRVGGAIRRLRRICAERGIEPWV